MKARDYFAQAYRLDQRIRSKLDQVQSLSALATKATSTLTSMPRIPNCNTSAMEEAIVKFVDLQAEINLDMERLVNLKREIVALVKSVDNTEFQTLLEKRYLCYMSWEQIAVDMNYSIHHLYKIHIRALDICDEFLNHDT
ncbi:MAG: DUF1492 domain-containing protein [Eubacteriales bacterium]